ISTVSTRQCDDPGTGFAAMGGSPPDGGGLLNQPNRYRLAAQTQSLFGDQHHQFAVPPGCKVAAIPAYADGGRRLSQAFERVWNSGFCLGLFSVISGARHAGACLFLPSEETL